MNPKIQTLSKNLLRAFNVLLVIMPVAAVIPWLFGTSAWVGYLNAPGWLAMFIDTPIGSVPLRNLHGTLPTLVGTAGAVIGILPIFLSLFALKKLFRNYQTGNIFSVDNAKQYKYLGWLFLWDALLAQPISGGLKVVGATLNHHPTYLILGFGAPNVQAVFCGIIMIVISWIMLEASKLHDEQKLII